MSFARLNLSVADIRKLTSYGQYTGTHYFDDATDQNGKIAQLLNFFPDKFSAVENYLVAAADACDNSVESC